jgi:hypothetical protein
MPTPGRQGDPVAGGLELAGQALLLGDVEGDALEDAGLPFLVALHDAPGQQVDPVAVRAPHPQGHVHRPVGGQAQGIGLAQGQQVVRVHPVGELVHRPAVGLGGQAQQVVALLVGAQQPGGQVQLPGDDAGQIVDQARIQGRVVGRRRHLAGTAGGTSCDTLKR